MSQIFRAMVRSGHMTESEIVAIYAAMTTLTRWGFPGKAVMMQLLRMVPRERLFEFEEDVEKIIDDMVGVKPEAPPRESGRSNELTWRRGPPGGTHLGGPPPFTFVACNFDATTEGTA